MIAAGPWWLRRKRVWKPGSAMPGRALRHCLSLLAALSVCTGLLQAFLFSRLMGRGH